MAAVGSELLVTTRDAMGRGCAGLEHHRDRYRERARAGCARAGCDRAGCDRNSALGQRGRPAPPVVAEEPAGTTQRSDITAPQPAVPQQEVSSPPVATEPPPPVTAERHVPKPHAEPSRHAAPAAPQLHEKRHVARPAVEPQTPALAPKKTARENRGAKQTDEALNAVRRFQDNLRDIPVSSYAGDGTRRTIVIRPTSIQDVYYYSAPR